MKSADMPWLSTRRSLCGKKLRMAPGQWPERNWGPQSNWGLLGAQFWQSASEFGSGSCPSWTLKWPRLKPTTCLQACERSWAEWFRLIRPRCQVHRNWDNAYVLFQATKFWGCLLHNNRTLTQLLCFQIHYFFSSAMPHLLLISLCFFQFLIYFLVLVLIHSFLNVLQSVTSIISFNTLNVSLWPMGAPWLICLFTCLCYFLNTSLPQLWNQLFLKGSPILLLENDI